MVRKRKMRKESHCWKKEEGFDPYLACFTNGQTVCQHFSMTWAMSWHNQRFLWLAIHLLPGKLWNNSSSFVSSIMMTPVLHFSPQVVPTWPPKLGTKLSKPYWYPLHMHPSVSCRPTLPSFSPCFYSFSSTVLPLPNGAGALQLLWRLNDSVHYVWTVKSSDWNTAQSSFPPFIFSLIDKAILLASFPNTYQDWNSEEPVSFWLKYPYRLNSELFP